MKQTVASESEDGLTLCEFDFVLSEIGNHGIAFSFVAFRRWQRDRAGELAPWYPEPEKWFAVDISGKSSIKETPEVPEAVLTEAKKFILSRITFDI